MRKDILSPESWDRFYEQHKPKIAEPTDEVMQCEQEEKEAIEQEAKILREKCRTR